MDQGVGAGQLSRHGRGVGEVARDELDVGAGERRGPHGIANEGDDLVTASGELR